MIRTETVITVKIKERDYELHCASDSPLGELHDALMQMKGYCVERMISAQQEEMKIAEEMKPACTLEGDQCS